MPRGALSVSETFRQALAEVDVKSWHPADRIRLVQIVAEAMFPGDETATLIREAMEPFWEDNYVRGGPEPEIG